MICAVNIDFDRIYQSGIVSKIKRRRGVMEEQIEVLLNLAEFLFGNIKNDDKGLISFSMGKIPGVFLKLVPQDDLRMEKNFFWSKDDPKVLLYQGWNYNYHSEYQEVERELIMNEECLNALKAYLVKKAKKKLKEM